MTEENKRGRGRPKTLAEPTSFTFEIEKKQKDFLKLLAKDANMKLGAYLRDVVTEYIEEWKQMRPDLVVEAEQGENDA